MLNKAKFKSCRDGFTAIELLLALVIAIPVLLGAACLAVAAIRASHDEKVTAQFTLPGDAAARTKVVSRRPTADVDVDAVTYHAVLSQALRHSVAFYVFGAAPQGVVPTTPSATSVEEIGPLQLSSWLDLTTGLIKARSAREFLTTFPSLGGTNPYTGSDFSVVVMGPKGGSIGMTALAQIVTTPATVSAPATASGDSLVLVWARLWTADGFWEYSWLAPQGNAANASWAARANQYWSWIDEARNVYEAGPAICQFPDPATAADTGVGISRFTYHL